MAKMTDTTPQPASASPTSSGNAMAVALRWFTALHEATHGLRDRAKRAKEGNVVCAKAEHSLKYFYELEEALKPFEKEWDQPPKVDPPLFVPWSLSKAYDKQPVAGPENEGPRDKQVREGPRNNNRFAVLEDYGDDLGDEQREVDASKREWDSTSSRDDDGFFSDDWETVGDVPALNRMEQFFPNGKPLSMRRLLIRILTAESELLAVLATSKRNSQSWAKGAEYCGLSLEKLHQGLQLADSECAKGGDEHIVKALLEDASIVEIAVRSLTTERDSLLQKAWNKKQRLMRVLEAESIQRQMIMERMGDRWFQSTKRGPSEHVKRRFRYEQQLLEVESALGQLVKMDTRPLIVSTGNLKLRLQPAGPDKEEEDDEEDWIPPPGFRNQKGRESRLSTNTMAQVHGYNTAFVPYQCYHGLSMGYAGFPPTNDTTSDMQFSTAGLDFFHASNPMMSPAGVDLNWPRLGNQGAHTCSPCYETWE